MKTKHTPEPWAADGYDIKQQPNGRHIAYVGPHHTQPHEYPLSCRLQDEANAALISAAPGLLRVCEEMRDEADGGWLLESPVAKRLLAAILKAKGTPC